MFWFLNLFESQALDVTCAEGFQGAELGNSQPATSETIICVDGDWVDSKGRRKWLQKLMKTIDRHIYKVMHRTKSIIRIGISVFFLQGVLILPAAFGPAPAKLAPCFFLLQLLGPTAFRPMSSCPVTSCFKKLPLHRNSTQNPVSNGVLSNTIARYGTLATHSSRQYIHSSYLLG